MYRLILLLVLFFLLTASVYAEDTSSGCGLGWQVTSDITLSATSTRGTTNAFLPNTFSMTSGTSGCAAHGLVLNDKLPMHYAEVNFETLKVEMARGDGEFILAFAQTLGCSDNSLFANTMKKHYGDIFSKEELNPIEMLSNVKTVIKESNLVCNI